MAGKKEDKNSLGHIDELKEDLYSRTVEIKKPHGEEEIMKSSFSDENVPTEWKTLDESPKKNAVTYRRLEHHVNLSKKILLGSVLLFIAASSFAVYTLFKGSNKISPENVDISVVGPVSIGAGDTLSFDVLIQNQNNVDLDGVNFLVEFPEGTRTADDKKSVLMRRSEMIGLIKSGSVVRRHLEAVMYGEANSIKTVTTSIEYRVKDSSATYFKEKQFDISISNAPVRMTVESLKEIVTGKELNFTAKIQSNSPTVVKNVLFKVDYPTGFSFVSSAPSAMFNNNVFVLGDLSPGEQRIIKIKGALVGSDGDQRNFHFTLGVQDPKDEKNVGIVFLSSDQLVTVQKAFVSLDLTFNGSADNPYAADPNLPITGNISWTNNLATRITDLEILVKVGGNALNRYSITTLDGFYRSIDNIILWDKTTLGDFAAIEPGQSGMVSFRLSSLPASSLLYSGIKGHQITADLSIKARRFSDANVPEDIVSSVTKTVKINSDLGLMGRSLYFTGPFKNQGPIPPKAEVNTTYTIVWTITNTLNDVYGARVSAYLPGYINWLGNVSPPSESVTYNPSTREIIWDAGDVVAGAGPVTSPKEVAFQLSFVPSLSQRYSAPTLVSAAALSGIDRYTGAVLEDSTGELTTSIADYFMQSGDTATVQP